MLNTNDLEQRWLRYKIKSYIPHAIIFLSVILILSLISLFMNKEPKIKEVDNNFNIHNVLNEESQNKEFILKETSIKKSHKQEIKPQERVEIPKQNNKMTISPSLDFMRQMQENTQTYFETNPEHKPVKKEKSHGVKPTPKPTPLAKKEEKVFYEEPQEEQIEKKSKSIKITRQNTHDDIKEVVTRFNKNNNPALSLFIAKKYYELGDYHKSYNYALITNEINNDIESSWIIFAKSLVKLNEKAMAIKVLKQYIQHSNSNRASLLLDKITSGKFK